MTSEEDERLAVVKPKAQSGTTEKKLEDDWKKKAKYGGTLNKPGDEKR